MSFESKGHFPLGGIFRAERHFLLFKEQWAESGRQKTKENIIPRGKFRLVENSPYRGSFSTLFGTPRVHTNTSFFVHFDSHQKAMFKNL